MRSFSKWSTANERWLSILAAALSAVLFSIYTGIATTAKPVSAQGLAGFVERLQSLGAVNLIAVAGILSLSAQATLAQTSTRSRRLRQREEGEQLTEALLEGVLGLIHAQNRRPIYRSLVAIADREAGVRTAVCGANIRTDPELNLSKPIDFGVAGEAFVARSMRAADLDDTNRDLAPDGTRVIGIWKETRSVLAFPMIASDRVAYGTLNFDSNDTLAASRLGERSVQEALGRIADVVTYLMRSYSRSGEASLPR
jgi:hypothetical protein